MGPLSNIRILDLTRVWAGPLSLRMLADFGAEVIKISDPRVPIEREAGLTNKLNRNKLGLALRLDEPEGRQLLLDLTNVSDVVIENFRPRVMRHFDLTYEDLKAVKPDIIMCSMPGFGTEGEYAEYPAFGPSVETMTGITSLMGYPGGPPMVSSIAYPDPVAAMNGSSALMTALLHRRRTGQGQFIDLALSEGPVCQIGEHIVAHSRTGSQPSRIGNTHPDHAPYGVYPCSGDDQWIAICVTSDDQWAILQKLIGNSDGADAHYADSASRVTHRAELDELVGQWTVQHDSRELTRTLQEHGIAAGAAVKNWQMLDDPHMNQRGFMMNIEEPDLGVKRYPGQAIRLSSTPATQQKPSPRLGEHTRQLLHDLLSMSDAEIDRHANQGIIGFMTD
ncbi:MAG: CoA transferase [SAR202 cluster bacterium]|nr:CoA transferase [SAR202 cluster bacterium]MDP6714776.1 CoA transferase [SAR202 cluster bacterium]